MLIFAILRYYIHVLYLWHNLKFARLTLQCVVWLTVFCYVQYTKKHKLVNHTTTLADFPIIGGLRTHCISNQLLMSSARILNCVINPTHDYNTYLFRALGWRLYASHHSLLVLRKLISYTACKLDYLRKYYTKKVETLTKYL